MTPPKYLFEPKKSQKSYVDACFLRFRGAMHEIPLSILQENVEGVL
jgi:hypothetical protein